MKLSRLLLALAFACPSVLHVAAQPAPRAAIVNARLVALSLVGDNLPGLVVKSADRALAFRAPADYLSDPFDYRGPARLHIFSKDAPPPPPGVAPVPLATVDLPPEGGEFLLLFAGNPGEPRVAVLDFSGKTAPLGSYLFWNLSRRPVGVALGDTNRLLSAGLREMLHPQAADRSYLPLRVFDEHDGAARQLFASRHFHRETTRQLVFITDNPDNDRVRLKIITQRVFTPFQPPVVAAATAR